MLLYIHIPFCDSKCFYCAFNSYVDKFELKKEYMKALNIQLLNELENYVQKHNKKIDTVFIGGGTPSTIKAHLYKDMFEVIKPYLSENCEITTEANPNSASKVWQEEMKALGVNRISFGVQSFNNEKLKKLGRSHNEKSAKQAIENASEIGFDSINCDIIYGVKDDTYEFLKEELATAFSLPISHISAYSLIIEEGTMFYDKEYMKIDDEELSYKLFDFIKENDFIQYEISNFAKNQNHKSKHNYGYWEHQEYLGIGCGAIGYYDKKRRYTNKIIEEYINNPLDISFEELSHEDILTEKVLLGFRCDNGVDLSLFSKEQNEKIDDLIKNDNLYIKDNRVYNKNFLLADELALYILG